jgi:hypothetical protein
LFTMSNTDAIARKAKTFEAKTIAELTVVEFRALMAQCLYDAGQREYARYRDPMLGRPQLPDPLAVEQLKHFP